MGNASKYLAGQRPNSTRYVEYSAWPIDNNVVRNTIRPLCSDARTGYSPIPSAALKPAPICAH
ncbi:transposase [Glaciimonas sp. PAMC28666]|uniref:IS66 family transposase n=1 Tax=Glaciimonas sp. PAMC28666 TaxID=2807626 RepID=UPI00196317B6|nr:transposase [Glaciimonas sp. PAMC28666]